MAASFLQGLNTLVWEIVDNAVDEYLNGYADSITVTLNKKGDAVTVTTTSWVSRDMHPKYKKTTRTDSTTPVWAQSGDNDTYIHSGGLHGVGSSVVNGLSRKLWRRFIAMATNGNSRSLAATRQPLRNWSRSVGHGTSIYFEPDESIFKTTRFDPDVIKSRLEDMSFIHRRAQHHRQI